MRRIAPVGLVCLLACASGEEAAPRTDTYVPTYPDYGKLYNTRLDSGGITGPCQKCDDGNLCTKDLCLKGGGCLSEFEPKGVACDDGDACTAHDRCDGAGQCNGDVGTDIVYRLKNPTSGAYYYSRSSSGGPKGYVPEKSLFRIRRQGDPATVPLYRLGSTSAAEFMLSLNATEASDCCGYQQDGVLGGIFPKQQPGTIALHRLKKLVPQLRHISTLDQQEGAMLGYQYEYQQGYVCPLE